jgi:predicted permease
MGNLLYDLHSAVRMLRRRPGQVVVCSMVIALVVGANTTVYSFAYNVLLKPLPFRDPDRLFRVWESNRTSGQTHVEVSPGTWVDWRDGNRSLKGLGAFFADDKGMIRTTEDGEDEWLAAASISQELLALLETAPVLGQPFLAGEEEKVVLISEGLWRRKFGGDRSVVGTTLTLDGRSWTIIGVLPESLRFLGAIEVWRPLVFSHQIGLRERGTRYLGVIARLEDGVSQEAALQDLDRLSTQLAAQYPSTNQGWSVTLEPLHETMTKNFRPALIALAGAVGLVFFLGCFNVTNILLARGRERETDLAVRVALGSGTAPLIRMLLVESLLLGLMGGVIGLIIGYWNVWFFDTLLPSVGSRFAIELDGGVLGYTLVVALAAGIAAGLVPAVRVSRPDLQTALKAGDRRSGREGWRSLGRKLMIAQIALTVVTLVASGVLVRSFVRLVTIDPGFQSGNLWTFEVRLPGRRASDNLPYVRQMIEETASLPGVTSAATVTRLPLSGNLLSMFVSLPGRQDTDRRSVVFNEVSDRYFETMRIPLVKGRPFGSDDESSESVVIVNEALARSLWPSGSAIGESIRIDLDQAPSRRVVGVVRDTRNTGLDAEPVPEVFVPYRQWALPFMSLVVRTAGDLPGLTSQLRSRVDAVNAEINLFRPRPMSEVISATVPQPRFTAMMMIQFSLVALLLAAAGVYGVVCVAVRERVRELGVRMAVGARSRDILVMITADTMRNVFIGLVVGLGAALAVTQWISSLLFEIRPFDATTFAAVFFLVTCVALLSAYLPARRAAALDPVAALASE